ncbi:MAG: hypothetical protein E7294_01355 [Lachnospiraceae bacterium]|nr:hypothetical protein [Lachnospiraceae bacterium]
MEFVVDNPDYEKMKLVFRQRTLEKTYKQILKSLDKAFHNINEAEVKSINKDGEFYRKGDLKQKAEQLWFTMPVTSVVNEEHQKYLEDTGLLKKKESFDVVESERNHFFEDIFQKANAKSVHFNLRVAK